MNPHLVFTLTLFATLFCTAINCYTWRLAYPLWRQLDPTAFARLHHEYLRLLFPVITLPHVAMFFASAALVVIRPPELSRANAIAVFALDSAVVALSAFWAGPIHSRFTRLGAWDDPGLTTLLRISALRSVLMLLASVILSISLLSH